MAGIGGFGQGIVSGFDVGTQARNRNRLTDIAEGDAAIRKRQDERAGVKHDVEMDEVARKRKAAEDYARDMEEILGRAPQNEMGPPASAANPVQPAAPAVDPGAPGVDPGAATPQAMGAAPAIPAAAPQQAMPQAAIQRPALATPGINPAQQGGAGQLTPQQAAQLNMRYMQRQIENRLFKPEDMKAAMQAADEARKAGATDAARAFMLGNDAPLRALMAKEYGVSPDSIQMVVENDPSYGPTPHAAFVDAKGQQRKESLGDLFHIMGAEAVGGAIDKSRARRVEEAKATADIKLKGAQANQANAHAAYYGEAKRQVTEQRQEAIDNKLAKDIDTSIEATLRRALKPDAKDAAGNPVDNTAYNTYVARKVGAEINAALGEKPDAKSLAQLKGRSAQIAANAQAEAKRMEQQAEQLANQIFADSKASAGGVLGMGGDKTIEAKKQKAMEVIRRSGARTPEELKKKLADEMFTRAQ